MYKHVLGLVAAGVLCGAPHAAAQDLFSITAGGITATGSDVIDLSESAIETFGPFATLSGGPVNAVVDFAGVPGAITFDVNTMGTAATLAFPITGFSQGFVGTDADDLADQIEDFILEEGSDAYAEFLEAIREQSLVAVLDGNPGATTARLARQTFDLYALGTAGPAWANPHRVEFDDAGDYAVDDPQTDFYDDPFVPAHRGRPVGWFEITPRFESTQAGPFDGATGSIDIAGGLSFNRAWGVSAGGSLVFTDFEDTEIFHSTFHAALSVAPVPPQPFGTPDAQGRRNLIGWELSPFFHTGVGLSVDAASGGAFAGLGLASRVELGLKERVSVRWGSQILYANGLDVEFEDDDDDDLEFETDLSQSLVSTGVIATALLDDRGGFFIEGGASYTAFLDNAAVDEWITPEIGLGWQYGGSRIRVAYRPIFGSGDFESQAVDLNFVFAY